MNTQHLIDLDRLAWMIDADGVNAHVAEMADVAAFAEQRGLRSPVVSLLTDTSVPAVVRQRAYGYVALRLGRPAGAPAAPWSLAA